MAGIWVFPEQRGAELKKVGFEILSMGRKLADKAGEELGALLLGSDVEMLAPDLAKYGADRVYLADSADLKDFLTESYTSVICDAVIANEPSILLFGATTLGKDLAPRVAARLGTSLATDCTELGYLPESYLSMSSLKMQNRRSHRCVQTSFQSRKIRKRVRLSNWRFALNFPR